MTGPTLIGEVVVTPGARPKVRVGKRGGRELVDLRLLRGGDGTGLLGQATKRRFALPRKSLPARVELLQMAEGHRG